MQHSFASDPYGYCCLMHGDPDSVVNHPYKYQDACQINCKNVQCGDAVDVPEYDMDIFEMEPEPETMDPEIMEPDMVDDEDPGAPDGTIGCGDGTIVCKQGSFCNFGSTCTRNALEGEPCISSRIGLGGCAGDLVCVDLSGGGQTAKLNENGFATEEIDFSQTQCQVAQD